MFRGDGFVGERVPPIRRLALWAIRGYMRFISPYKGFRCAYRVYTGGASCSQLGYRAIRRHGLVRGFGLLRARTYRCGVAHRRYAAHSGTPGGKQRGDCDPGCDFPCDGCADRPTWRWLSRWADALSCCDIGSCDWPSRDSKRGKDGKRRGFLPRRSRHGKADAADRHEEE